MVAASRRFPGALNLLVGLIFGGGSTLGAATGCAGPSESGLPVSTPASADGAEGPSESTAAVDAAPEPSTSGRVRAKSGASKTPDPVNQAPGLPVTSPAESAGRLPLPSGTKVLHVGDSFAGALGIHLSKRLEEAGLRSVLQSEDASYITGWAWGEDFQRYIWRYNPDLVLITLGANELGIVNPEQRIRAIRKLVDTIGDRPCVWIAIPLWNGKQNGLMDVIAENVAPCVFMDTNTILDPEEMPRISDGIHPTRSAREEWADVVVGWLQKHRRPTSEHPWHLELAPEAHPVDGAE